MDEFLAALPDDQRAALEDLRGKIRARPCVPEAEEAIGYGVPAFKYRGRPLVSLGGGRGHCSFHVQDLGVVQELAPQIEAAGLTWSGGTIRFPATARVPAALVEKVVAARRAQLDGGR
ncbi:MAG: iron chaperone [Candidatus Limnocylindria bacterium]